MSTKKRTRGKSRLYFAIQPGSRKVVMSAKKKKNDEVRILGSEKNIVLP